MIKLSSFEKIKKAEKRGQEKFGHLAFAEKSLTKSALDRKLRGASGKIKQQAYQTWKQDKVQPGRMVLSLKPLRPAPAGERQTISQFYKYIEENLEFPLYVSAKRDGGTVYASGDGKGKVWLFSDDGEDVTEKLPSLVEALKKSFIDKSFYCGTEVEYWKDGNHYPREAAVGAIKRGDDENLAMNIFRVVYWDGEDLHKKRFSEALEIAQKLPVDTKSDGALYPRKNGPINLVPHYKVGSISALKERLEKVAYKPGVEGVVVKRADGGFPLDGEPDSQNPEETKWHKSFSAKYVCLGQNETATRGVYTTWLGLPIERSVKGRWVTIRGKPVYIGDSKYGSAQKPRGSDTSTKKADEFLANGLSAEKFFGSREPLKEAPPWDGLTKETRSDVKDEIANELSGMSGTDYDDADDFIHLWSMKSSEGHALSLQVDAAHEFEIPPNKYISRKYEEMIGKLQPKELELKYDRLLDEDVQRKLLRAMYDNTQEKLKNASFKPDDVIRLRRGVKVSKDFSGKKGESINLEMNPVSSWSTSREMASRFASKASRDQKGIVLEADIPVKMILSSARTGFGCLTEGEFTVLGMGGQGEIVEEF